MTKTFTIGEIDVVVTCNALNKMLIIGTDGIDSHELDFTYPTEYLRDLAYKAMSEEMAATLAIGLSKVFMVTRQLSS
jgi:hypothetical protein